MPDLPRLNAAAAPSTTFLPSGVSDDLSNSKKTMNTCFDGATAAGGGAGGAATAGVRAGGAAEGAPKCQSKPTRMMFSSGSNVVL